MNILAFVVAFVLFVGGIALFGYSFDAAGYQTLVFCAGILAIVLSVAIPFHALRRIDR